MTDRKELTVAKGFDRATSAEAVTSVLVRKGLKPGQVSHVLPQVMADLQKWRKKMEPITTMTTVLGSLAEAQVVKSLTSIKSRVSYNLDRGLSPRTKINA